MKSAASFYSGAIFRKNLLRFWPLWAAYLLCWLLALPLPLLQGVQLTPLPPGALRPHMSYSVLELAVTPGSIIVCVFAIAGAMAVWGFLYGTKSSSAMATLPVKREGLFLSGALSALLPMTAVHVLVFLLALAAEAARGYVLVSYLLQWLGIVTLEMLLFFGMASFCAMLTGHIIALPVLYGLVNFTAVVVESVVRSILRCFLFGMSGLGGSALTFLSPLVNLHAGGWVRREWDEDALVAVHFNGWLTLTLYALAGLLLLGGAFLLLRRRRMETAGDVVAVRPLRPIFKYCFTAGCALVLGWLFHYLTYWGDTGPDTAVVMILFILLGCALGYFAAAMLLKKSFRVFDQWRGFLVSAAVVLALCLCCELDVTGFETRVPDASRVQRVSISESVEVTSLENVEAATALHRDIVASKAALEASDVGSTRLRFTYTMTDGSTLVRLYALPVDYNLPLAQQSDLVLDYQALLNSREAIVNRVLPETPVTVENIAWSSLYWTDAQGVSDELYLDAAQALHLWQDGILPDLEAGNIGQMWVIRDHTELLDCHFYMELADRELEPQAGELSYTTAQAGLDIQVGSVHTLAILAELGVYPATYEQIETAYSAARPATISDLR